MRARSTRSLTLTKGNIVLFIFIMFTLSTRTPQMDYYEINDWISTQCGHMLLCVFKTLFLLLVVPNNNGTHFYAFAYFFSFVAHPVPFHLHEIYLCMRYHHHFHDYGKYTLNIFHLNLCG